MEKFITSLYNNEIQIEFNPNTHRYRLVDSKEWILSVTSIISIIDKSAALINWAIGLTHDSFMEFVGSIDSDVNLLDRSAVIEAFSNALKQHKKVKEEAADNGTLVHAFLEAYGRAKLYGEPMPPIGEDLPDQVIAGINAALDWINQNKIEFVETEKLVYSKTYGYAGLVDAVVKIDNAYWLIDYKTSKRIYSSMNYQVAAYRNAYDEEMMYGDDTEDDEVVFEEATKYGASSEKKERYPLCGSMIVHFDKITGAFSVKKIQDDDYRKDFATFEACMKVKEREKELANEE